MMIIYNLLLFVPIILSIPISYILLSKDEFLRRYALLLPEVKNPIWIHCASLGELNAVKPLISNLKILFPEKDILITTTSRTGLEEAKKITRHSTFLPIDFYLMIKKFIKKIQPEILIVAETEFWPNLFYYMKNIMIVNARISDKTFGKYKLIKPFLKTLSKNISYVCAQSEEDKHRFLSLGFKNVKNFGNLKFAVTLNEVDRIQLRNKLNYHSDDFIIIWGSSRPGEEKLIINLFPTLKRIIPKLKLILVPRHLNRLNEIKNLLDKYSLYSQNENKEDILLVDKIGILANLYAISDVAIIGGSFFDYGGHNPLEAVYHKIPVIIGNYHSSCKDTVKILKNSFGIEVATKENLMQKIIFLYQNPDKREQLGINAYKCMKKNSESLNKTLDCILKVVKNG